MKIERVWYPETGDVTARLCGAALSPLSLLYRAGLGLRGGAGASAGAGCPVLSVGNLTVGGNGKTPLALELCRLAQMNGLRPALVFRGYGRRTGEVRVAHRPGARPPAWQDVGDEPAFLARRLPDLPMVVGRDRVAAALLAVREFSPDLVVCDDAFQHRALHRDLDILAWNVRRGAGNGRLLPAGPLREPLSAARRADLVVFVNAASRPLEVLRAQHGLPAGVPAVGCDLVPEGWVAAGDWSRLLAAPGAGAFLGVCAIAHPGGFLESCRRAGIELAGSLAFRDHHAFSKRELADITARARALGAAGVLTTEKDLVRLEGAAIGLPVFALRLSLRWGDGAEELLVRRLLELVERSCRSDGE